MRQSILQQSPIAATPSDPTLLLHTNVKGTYNLLEAVRKHQMRFYRISADEVHGKLVLDDSTKFTDHDAGRSLGQWFPDRLSIVQLAGKH